MAQEIDIHRSLSHKHIVGFTGFFEDKDNVYVLLELCRRRVSIHVACTCTLYITASHMNFHVQFVVELHCTYMYKSLDSVVHVYVCY